MSPAPWGLTQYALIIGFLGACCILAYTAFMILRDEYGMEFR
jgi:hypothetical protein